MDTRHVSQFFKGIAIVLVFLCHSHQTFTLPEFLTSVLSFLQSGVQLFILLSAFGLCYSYSKTPVKWFSFMKTRLSKIVILYWFAIALAAIYRVAYACVMHKDILQEVNPLGIFINALLLHGFSPDRTINNYIVRGGWFIGAIVVIYAVFPLMYRLYFSNNKVWRRTRIYLFPLAVFIVTSILVGFLNAYPSAHSLTKLILQLAPFALGFPLFELQQNHSIYEIKYPCCKGIVFVIVAFGLFLLKTEAQRAYMFTVGIAFFYFMIYVLKKQKGFDRICSRLPVCRFFSAMGEYSFPIYLTHSYIAFDLCFVLTAVLSHICQNDLLWFVLLQPFAIGLSYYVGKYFDIVVNSLVLHRKLKYNRQG